MKIILFARDWQDYPTAIIDVHTRNRSYVRLASVYREMGIKNHAFLLALINPRLQGVDPHSPKLTAEQIIDIAIECAINPWYFFREVARVPAQASDESMMLEGNRGNIALWWCFFNHLFTILIQPRQTGKSLSTDELMAYLLNIICKNTKINLLTLNDKLRRENVQRLKDVTDSLPAYLNQRSKSDVNNGEEITINARGNHYKTHVPRSSEKDAYNLGRGITSPIVQFDEAPFQTWIKVAMGAMLASMGAIVEKAAALGVPYGMILTTTAGKIDDRDGGFIYSLVQKAMPWSERLFDCQTEAELRKVVTTAAGGDYMVNCTFNHKQLGKTDEWLAQRIRMALQDGEDASRDFLNIWTTGSEGNPLDKVILQEIRNSAVGDFVPQISEHGYMTRWYIPENEIEHRMATGQFVMGMDTSDAIGKDDISMVMVDIETLETVAAGTFNETNIAKFSEWLCAFLVKYKNVTAVVERRSTGTSILDALIYTLPGYREDPFKRLFNKVVNDYDEYPDRFREIDTGADRRRGDVNTRYRQTFGYATSASGSNSRDMLYGKTLFSAAKQACRVVHDTKLINQIAGLETRNGRIDHSADGHDDMVVGWLLCHWFLTHAKNLKFYGINPLRVRSGMINTVETITPEMQYRKREQNEIRRKIEELYDRLGSERDDYVSLAIERELRLLNSRVILEENESYSIDDLINRARERRKSTHTRKQGYGPTPQHARQTDYSGMDRNGLGGFHQPRVASMSPGWRY